MTDRPIMTIGMLRSMLNGLGSGHDKTPVTIWLPGQYIVLTDTLTLGAATFEGNVVTDNAKGAQAIKKERPITLRDAVRVAEASATKQPARLVPRADMRTVFDNAANTHRFPK